MVHFVSSFQPPSVICPLTAKQETPTGTLESIEGFSPAFKAKVNFGADWLRFDPDRAHGRIDLKGIARTEEGHSISFGYVGIIDMDEDVWKIFNMQPDMKTVPFGNAGLFTHPLVSLLFGLSIPTVPCDFLQNSSFNAVASDLGHVY